METTRQKQAENTLGKIKTMGEGTSGRMGQTDGRIRELENSLFEDMLLGEKNNKRSEERLGKIWYSMKIGHIEFQESRKHFKKDSNRIIFQIWRITQLSMYRRSQRPADSTESRSNNSSWGSNPLQTSA